MPRSARVFALLAVLTAPAAALAWQERVPFGARVHGHEFTNVALDASDCALKVRLDFDAPKDGYENESAQRNYYRFAARLKFKDGRVVPLPSFGNTGPGARVWEYSYDTTHDGCWSKTEQKLSGIDVEGCRGRGCKPKEFPP